MNVHFTNFLFYLLFRFLYRDSFLQENVPYVILKKPENVEALMKIMKSLNDIDIIELCRSQNFWLKDWWPLNFPGEYRQGQSGLPPLLKNCTANNKSKDRLKLYLRVHGSINLPKNIIIDHGDGRKSLIRERFNTPPNSFHFVVDILCIRVSKGMDDSTNDDANTSEVQFNQDGGDGSGNDNEDLDDTVVMELNEFPTEPTPNALRALRNESRFEPGEDGLGSLHTEKRRVSPFLQPWNLPDKQIQTFTRMTKANFLNFCEDARGATLRKGVLGYRAECLLFLIYLTNHCSLEVLSGMFNVAVSTAHAIYLRILMWCYNNMNNIPKIIREDGHVDVDVKRRLYEKAYENTEEYYQQLTADLRDPSGRGRIPVPLNVDATYIDMMGSSDNEVNRHGFYVGRARHVTKFLNFTDTSGKIVGVLSLASSQSPSSGDHFLVQRHVDLEDTQLGDAIEAAEDDPDVDERDLPSEGYVRALLSGNDTHFVVLFCDTGFVVDPPNKPRVLRNCPTLKDICDDCNALIIHPSSKHEPYMLARDPDGKIVKTEPDEDDPTMIENSIKYCRIVRKPQEMIHASLKNEFGFLNHRGLPTSFLLPLSEDQLQRFGLPIEKYGKVPKLTYSVMVSASLLNRYHPGYSILYLKHRDQGAAANRLLARMFVRSPMIDDIFPADTNLDCAGGWRPSTFGRLAEHNLGFPILQGDLYPAVDLLSGPHAYFKANNLLTYMGQLTIKEQRLNLDVEETREYLENFPADWKVEFRHIRAPANFRPTPQRPRWCPDWWNENDYGEWRDLTFIRAKIPPSYKSPIPQNHHIAVIVFSNTNNPSNHRSLLPPYDKVVDWKCFKCPAKNGSMSMCRHLSTLLMAISYFEQYRSTFRGVCWLNTVAQSERQNLVIFPPGPSREMPSLGQVPHRSSNPRQNHPIYRAPSSTASSSSTTVSTSATVTVSSTAATVTVSSTAATVASTATVNSSSTAGSSSSLATPSTTGSSSSSTTLSSLASTASTLSTVSTLATSQAAVTSLVFSSTATTSVSSSSLFARSQGKVFALHFECL